MSLSLSNFIKVYVDMCGTICTFIVDTGADISIFKREKIDNDQLIYPKNICMIQGITDTKRKSIGATYAKLHFNEQFIVEHVFQIVDNDFAIEADAILGRDFLRKFKAVIDYDTWTLTLNTDGNSIQVPILSGPTSSSVVVPPRCEIIREIKLPKNVQGDIVIPGGEILPGIFAAGTVTSASKPLVKILNTNNRTCTISKINVETIPLADFNILKTNIPKAHRASQILSKLNLTNIPEYARSQLEKLCCDYQDIFAVENEPLTTNNFYQQDIELIDSRPVYTKNYRIPEAHKQEINRQVEKMLADGIIENSVSQFNSPILLVPKKATDNSKKWRLVVDFRNLNKKILGDKFPLPRIEDILDQMGRAKYFSTLDLMSGFHQIPLEQNSRKLTAFSTSQGHYQYTRLPFGLNISPNSFQRMMSIAMAGLTPEVAFLYIDDIIVIGCSQAHHLKNLTKVFNRLRDRNLKLNPDKCKFFQTEVTYLGHQISAQGVKPDTSKYDTIKNYPVPKSADDVRRFVAFCNYYRRFVPNFADIAQPLNKLLKKNAKFEWSDIHQRAFNTLKSILMSPTILQYPNFQETFIISTDASNVACGAILAQNVNGVELPIAFASKTFTPGEKNKSTIEKELAAIHWAITYFKPYVYGRKFIVKSDHRPLAYLFGMKNPSSKLTRMRLDLEEFDFEVQFVEGKKNVGPDALSRIQLDSNDLKAINILQVQTRSRKKQENQLNKNEAEINYTEPQPDQLRVTEALSPTEVTDIPEIQFTINKGTQKQDKLEIKITDKCTKEFKRYINININQPVEPALVQVFEMLEENMNKLFQTKTLKLSADSEIFTIINQTAFKILANKRLTTINIIIYKPYIHITDKKKIQEILHNFHNTPTGGHLGQTRLYRKVKEIYRWKKMKKSVANYVGKCELCAKNKHQKRNKEPFEITTTPPKVFDTVSIDTVGPFTKTENDNRYAVTMQCDLSKYIIIIPTKDKEANTIARAMVEGFILTYGPMSKIKSDLGTEYNNKIFDEICKILRIKQVFATAAHPETIGALERNHKCLNEYLRCFVNENKDDWDRWIPYYSFCYNTTPNTVHGYTPFELVFAKKVSLPAELITTKPDPIYNYELYSKEVKFRLQSSLNKAKQNIELSKLRSQQTNNLNKKPSPIKIGDRVLLDIQDRRKLDSLYKGPYVVREIDRVNCIIESNNKTIKVHKNRLRKFDTNEC